MSITLTNIKNKSKSALELDELRQLPISIRDYFSGKKETFDNLYNNRSNDTYLQRFKSVKYNIQDRLYGSPNEDICNIFYSIFNNKETLQLIEQYTFDKKWTYHPIRKFDKWNKISSLYYGREDYYWLLLLFNRIVDPFQSVLNYNMIRVPYPSLIQDLPYRESFDFRGINFK